MSAFATFSALAPSSRTCLRRSRDGHVDDEYFLSVSSNEYFLSVSWPGQPGLRNEDRSLTTYAVVYVIKHCGIKDVVGEKLVGDLGQGRSG